MIAQGGPEFELPEEEVFEGEFELLGWIMVEVMVRVLFGGPFPIIVVLPTLKWLSMQFYTPLHVADWQTYTKRSSSQVLGGVALATVILMVWSPLLRPSFLNNWIGTPSWAAKELTVCWSAPSVDDGSEEKQGNLFSRTKIDDTWAVSGALVAPIFNSL